MTKLKEKKTKEPKGLQFVNWFPNWKGFYFKHWEGNMRLIYDWSLVLGFWEIRKRQTKSFEELKGGEMNYKQHRKIMLAKDPEFKKEWEKQERVKRGITKLFKPWIVKRREGNCQVLFALTELDLLVSQIIEVFEKENEP